MPNTPGDDAPTIKVVVVGDRGAGASDLISRFCVDAGAPAPRDPEAPFVELDLQDPAQQGPRVRAQFWDGRGVLDQPERKPSFFNGAMAALLLYDITSTESFESVVNTWYPDVQRHCADAFVMVVGCKCDQVSRRAVQVTDAESFAARHSLFFMEVSSLDGTNTGLTLTILLIRSAHTVRARQRLLAAEHADRRSASSPDQPSSAHGASARTLTSPGVWSPSAGGSGASPGQPYPALTAPEASPGWPAPSSLHAAANTPGGGGGGGGGQGPAPFSSISAILGRARFDDEATASPQAVSSLAARFRGQAESAYASPEGGAGREGEGERSQPPSAAIALAALGATRDSMGLAPSAGSGGGSPQGEAPRADAAPREGEQKVAISSAPSHGRAEKLSREYEALKQVFSSIGVDTPAPDGEVGEEEEGYEDWGQPRSGGRDTALFTSVDLRDPNARALANGGHSGSPGAGAASDRGDASLSPGYRAGTGAGAPSSAGSGRRGADSGQSQDRPYGASVAAASAVMRGRHAVRSGQAAAPTGGADATLARSSARPVWRPSQAHLRKYNAGADFEPRGPEHASGEDESGPKPFRARPMPASFRRASPPRVNAALRRRQMEQPLFHIDVRLPNGGVERMPYYEDDNAYHLAQQFVHEHKLRVGMVHKLSKLVEQRVQQYVEEVQRQEQARRRRESLRSMKEWREKFTTVQAPFQLSGGGGRKARLAKGPIVGRVKVEFRQGKVGTIVVRERDDPAELVRTFCRTYALKPAHARQITAHIQSQVDAARQQTARLENGPSGADGAGGSSGSKPRRRSPSSAQQRARTAAKEAASSARANARPATRPRAVRGRGDTSGRAEQGGGPEGKAESSPSSASARSRGGASASAQERMRPSSGAAAFRKRQQRQEEEEEAVVASPVQVTLQVSAESPTPVTGGTATQGTPVSRSGVERAQVAAPAPAPTAVQASERWEDLVESPVGGGGGGGGGDYSGSGATPRGVEWPRAPAPTPSSAGLGRGVQTGGVQEQQLVQQQQEQQQMYQQQQQQAPERAAAPCDDGECDEAGAIDDALLLGEDIEVESEEEEKWGGEARQPYAATRTGKGWAAAEHAEEQSLSTRQQVLLARTLGLQAAAVQQQQQQQQQGAAAMQGDRGEASAAGTGVPVIPKESHSQANPAADDASQHSGSTSGSHGSRRTAHTMPTAMRRAAGPAGSVKRGGDAHSVGPGKPQPRSARRGRGSQVQQQPRGTASQRSLHSGLHINSGEAPAADDWGAAPVLTRRPAEEAAGMAPAAVAGSLTRGARAKLRQAGGGADAASVASSTRSRRLSAASRGSRASRASRVSQSPAQSGKGRGRGVAASGAARDKVPLFNLDVEIGGGKSKRIVVHETDDCGTLAAAFVQQHGLPDRAVKRLQRVLEDNVRVHRERTAGAEQ